MANVQTMYRALVEARLQQWAYCWVDSRTIAATGQSAYC